MQLAQVRHGHGPTLVLLRQLEKPLWEPVIERLTRVREVVAVDLPGTGESATSDWRDTDDRGACGGDGGLVSLVRARAPAGGW